MAIADDIKAYWKFDESSGNASDSVGSNTLVNNNTATYSTGKINNGAYCADASNQFFKINSSSDLRIKDDLTIAGWFYFDSTEIMWLVDKRSESGEDFSMYALYFSGGNTIALRTTNGSSSSLVDRSVAWTPSTSTWYHIAVTRKSSDGSIKFYINGSQQGSTQTGYTGTLRDNSDLPFYVGRYKDSGENDRDLDGRVDELGVWARELTSTEIGELYNSGDGLQYPFTVATPKSNLLMLGVG